MTTIPIDRAAMSQALAKAIAFKNAGNHEEAAKWAGILVQLLRDADIQFN